VQQNQTPGQLNNGFQIFKKEAESIQNEYPGLMLDIDAKNATPSISGIIQLEDEKGSFIDSYKLKIVPTTDYPNQFPNVFEIGGRIPINIDWHVYPDDGHCCISSIPEEILICKNGISLNSFIENQLKPYLFNQKYREVHGFFLKERPHGNKGNIQFFIEVFQTNDLTTIVKWLIFIRQRNEPNRVSKCFCGSSQKYRKCHRKTYRTLSAFTNQELDYFIDMILKFG
jgi:hypothetical protein